MFMFNFSIYVIV